CSKKWISSRKSCRSGGAARARSRAAWTSCAATAPGCPRGPRLASTAGCCGSRAGGGGSPSRRPPARSPTTTSGRPRARVAPASATFLITKDVSLRIRADALGLHSTDYDTQKIEVEELYSGTGEAQMAGGDIDRFYAEGSIELAKNGFYANQYLLLRDRDNP